MLIALGAMVLGGVLVYSAFQTPPDPRVVVQKAFGGATKATTTTTKQPLPVAHGTQLHGRVY